EADLFCPNSVRINFTIYHNQADSLYDRPFLVWRYGPVEKDIYETYRVYGSDPIVEKHSQNPELKALNPFIENELKKDPFTLVNESHQEKYWQDNMKKIVGWRSDVPYSLENIERGK
ncbi:DUF4065 domain-containing protein, partial [Companilactobacillus crustorum]